MEEEDGGVEDLVAVAGLESVRDRVSGAVSTEGHGRQWCRVAVALTCLEKQRDPGMGKPEVMVIMSWCVRCRIHLAGRQSEESLPLSHFTSDRCVGRQMHKFR